MTDPILSTQTNPAPAPVDPMKDPEFVAWLAQQPKPQEQQAAASPVAQPAPTAEEGAMGDGASADGELPDLSFHYDNNTDKKIRTMFRPETADALLSGNEELQKQTISDISKDDPYMASWARTNLNMNTTGSYSPSVGKQAKDAVVGAEKYVRESVTQAPANAVLGAADALDNSIKFGTMIGNNAVASEDQVDTKNVSVFNQSHEHDSMVRDVAAFTAGFAGAGKVLGFIKNPMVKSALAAGLGSSVTMDATPTGRLSDLVEAYPHLQNPISEFLAANNRDGASKDESDAMGRLRNGLENTLAGPVVDKLMGVVAGAAKWIKGKVKPGTPEAAAIEQEIAAAVEKADVPATPDVPPKEIPVTEPSATSTKMLPQDVSDKILKAAQEGVSPEDSLRHVNINVPKMTDSVTAANAIHQLALELPDGALATKGWNLQQNAKEAADLLGVGPADFAKGLTALAGDADKIPQYLVASRMVLAQKSTELGNLAKQVIGPASSPEVIQAFRGKLSELQEFKKPFLELQAGGARGVTSGNTKVAGAELKDGTVVGQALNPEGKVIAQTGGEGVAKVTPATTQGTVHEAAVKAGLSSEEAEMAAKMAVVSDGDWKTAAKLAGAASKGITVFNEVFINAILSGPKTLVANTAALVTIAGQPIEKIIGGSIQYAMGRQAGKESMLEGAAHLGSLWSATFDTFAAMKKGWESPVLRTLKNEAGVLDKSHGTVDTPHAITAANLLPEGLQGTSVGSAVDWAGKTIRIPTRLMTTTDELLKQINYRAFISARATREGLHKGLQGGELQSFMTDYMSKAFDEAGAGTHAAALANSQKATFTNPLLDGTVGSGISKLASDHPMVRTVIPFIRTPTNIIRGIGQRTPIVNMIYKEVRQDIAAGGHRASEALGKMAMGTTLYTGALMLAGAGMITGGGPKDPTLKAAKMATGWQPYSVKVGDKYYGFNRLDPVSSFLGLAADFHEVSGQIDEGTSADMAGTMTLALMRNLSNKTYLMGLTNALDAIAKPEVAGKRFTMNLLGGAVPFSGLSKAVNNEVDPYANDVRSYMDAMRSSVPGYGATLSPRRDLFGQPVLIPDGFGPDFMSPVAMSKDVKDSVKDEIARLSHAFELPSSKVSNVDLRDYVDKSGKTAFEHYQELTGTVTRNGMDLKEAMATLIESSKYKDNGTDPMGSVGQGSRVSDIQVLLEKYRDKALRQTKEDYPEVKQALGQDKMNKGDLKHNRLDQIIKLTK